MDSHLFLSQLEWTTLERTTQLEWTTLERTTQLEWTTLGLLHRVFLGLEAGEVAVEAAPEAAMPRPALDLRLAARDPGGPLQCGPWPLAS